MSELSSKRLSPFEWLRALAVLCVVMLHACVPYLTHAMQGLAWPVNDAPSPLINSLFWSIELFIMPLFLVMAGFFAVSLLRKRGHRDFVKHRASRLLLPLVVVGAVILPLDLYSWLLGWVVEGQIDFRKLQSLKFEAGQDQHLWGLSHLWFLQYLFLYCTVYAVVHAYWPARLQTLSARFWLRRSSLYALFATGTVTLIIAPEVVFGFQHSFLPFASKWIYSGTFFAGGIWLAIYDAELRRTRRLGPRVLMIGVVAMTAGVIAGNQYLAGNGSPLVRLLMVTATVAAAWGVTAGLIGVAMRYATASNRAVRYLAAASFWIYLVHHPLMGLLHTDLKVLLPTAAPLLKVTLAFSVTLLLGLASFEVAVRRTALGRLLGVVQPRTETARTETARTDGSTAANPAEESLESRETARKETIPLRRAA